MNFDGILKQTGPADILFWKECCSSILLTENAPASEFESNQPSFSKVWILHTFALPITNQIIFNWITLIEEEKTHWWKFWELKSHKMFLHWKGEVRLSPAYHVIRPEKSSANFNSKFYANLDFKEFELQFLNLQQVYVPC